MQQQKNFILFLILSMAILFGWHLLERWIWPPRMRLSEAEAKQVARDIAPFGLLNAVPVTPGAGGAAQVSTLIALSNTDKKQIIEMAAFRAKPKPPPVTVPPTERWVKTPFPAVPLAATVNPAFSLVAELALLNPETRRLALEAAQRSRREQMLAGGKFERVTIGEEDGGTFKYHIRARLSTKGAGVELLILNRFQRADDEGRHVFTTDAKGNKVPAPMELIQDDPVRASFLMYHYPSPKDDVGQRPYDTLGKQLWQLVKTNGKAVDVSKDGVQKVVFQTSLPGHEDVLIRKTYTLHPQQYHLGLTVEFERKANAENREPVAVRYQFAGAHGTPIEGEWFTTTYRNAVIGTVYPGDNLSRDLQDSRQIAFRQGGERVPLAARGNASIQYAGVNIQYFTSQIVVSDRQAPEAEGGVPAGNILAWARPTLESEQFKGHIVGIAKGDQTQLTVRNVEKGVATDRRFILLPRVRDAFEAKGFKEGDAVVVGFYAWEPGRYYATSLHHGTAFRPFLDDITVRVNSEPIELRPGAKVVHNYLLYNGPVKVRLLEQFSGEDAVSPPDLVDRYAYTLHLLTLTDYPSNEVGRWTGLSNLVILFTRLMHWLLDKLHWLLPSYGLDIILLTVIVRGLMFPVTRKSVMSMNRMQALAPEMKKVQEKYKNDPQAKSQAMMELYRKHNVSPLGGCLPLLLQMPIFFGLYFCLQESINFRLAPFLWINNLAAPDMLWRWGEGIFLISDPDNQAGAVTFLGLPLSFLYLGPYLNVLPIIAIVLMVMQQKLMMPPPTNEEEATRNKMMMWMSVFIGVLFYKVAAGLCLYFIVSSIWGMTERKLLPKKQPAGTVPPAAANVKSPKGPPPKPGKGPRGKPGKRSPKPRQPEGTMDKVKDWWSEVLKQAKKK